MRKHLFAPVAALFVVLSMLAAQCGAPATPRPGDRGAKRLRRPRRRGPKATEAPRRLRRPRRLKKPRPPRPQGD